MTLTPGRPLNGFWYLATPYTKFTHGTEAAFKHACKSAAVLIESGLRVLSPIAHCHPIATHGDIDPLDGPFWQAQLAPMMEAAMGLLVVMMPGWNESAGVAIEIQAFEKMRKPIVWLNWPSLSVAREFWPTPVPLSAATEPGPESGNVASRILTRAAKLVGHDREEQHGDKVKNFRNVAELWNGYLNARREPGSDLTAADIGHMMVLLKIARTQLGAFNMDDYDDAAGYAGCAGQVAQELHEQSLSEARQRVQKAAR